MRKYTYGFSALVLVALAACSVFGVPTPETFRERLAAGYVTVTSARTSATLLLDNRIISAEDGLNVLEQTDNARAGLDIARSMETADLSNASAKLDAVLAGLRALDGYLCVKKGGRYTDSRCIVEGRP